MQDLTEFEAKRSSQNGEDGVIAAADWPQLERAVNEALNGAG